MPIFKRPAWERAATHSAGGGASQSGASGAKLVFGQTPPPALPPPPVAPSVSVKLFLPPGREWARAYHSSASDDMILSEALLPTLRYWAAVVAHRVTPGLRAADTIFANEVSGYLGLRRALLDGWQTVMGRISPAMWALAWHDRLDEWEREALTHLSRAGDLLPAPTLAERHVATLEAAIAEQAARDTTAAAAPWDAPAARVIS